MNIKTDRKLLVFLCHASQDKPIVRELYQRLFAENWIHPWLDEEKLLPGHDWDIEIEKAVEAADAIIVCPSSTSVSKEEYVQKEIKAAFNVALFMPEETIFMVPLRFDECILARILRSIQFIDFFPMERKEWAYSRLRQSLKVRLEQVVNRLEEERSHTEREERERKANEKKTVERLKSIPTKKTIIPAIVMAVIGFVASFWLDDWTNMNFLLAMLLPWIVVFFAVGRFTRIMANAELDRRIKFQSEKLHMVN